MINNKKVKVSAIVNTIDIASRNVFRHQMPYRTSHLHRMPPFSRIYLAIYFPFTPSQIFMYNLQPATCNLYLVHGWLFFRRRFNYLLLSMNYCCGMHESMLLFIHLVFCIFSSFPKLILVVCCLYAGICAIYDCIDLKNFYSLQTTNNNNNKP